MRSCNIIMISMGVESYTGAQGTSNASHSSSNSIKVAAFLVQCQDMAEDFLRKIELASDSV